MSDYRIHFRKSANKSTQNEQSFERPENFQIKLDYLEKRFGV